MGSVWANLLILIGIGNLAFSCHIRACGTPSLVRIWGNIAINLVRKAERVLWVLEWVWGRVGVVWRVPWTPPTPYEFVIRLRSQPSV